MPDLSDFQGWAESVNLWQVIGWTAGAIGLVVFLVWFKRKGWPWLLAFAKAVINTAEIIDSVKGLPDFIERTDRRGEDQDRKISEIHHEVHYNNGSSVKDAVSRVESGVAGLYQKVDELSAADAKLREDLDNTIPKPNKE